MRLYQANLLYENGLSTLTYDTLVEMCSVYQKEYYRCSKLANKTKYLRRLIDCKSYANLLETKLYEEQLEKLMSC